MQLKALNKISLFALFCSAILIPNYAFAYIGPGAGVAFLGSALVFVVTALLAVLTILLWPFQWTLRKLRGFGVSRKARFQRIVIVGLDGLEPKLAEKYMQAGELPNLKKLSETGSYQRLGTTLPALSPVAWSSFQTGVNPGAHNIFDFLTRDKRFYLPVLASTENKTFKTLFSRLGLAKVKTRVQITRKATPFWKILGTRGIHSNIIRVPISYPPENFYGNILGAMCTPDLKGSQGSFTFYTNQNDQTSSEQTGGVSKSFEVKDNFYFGKIDGPPLEKGYASIEFKLEIVNECANFHVGDNIYKLEVNQFSDWINLDFKVGKNIICGIVRVCLREITPIIKLYISPVNVNPLRPALPIAQPLIFANWLARKIGLFGTLGLMEDTWGRNEHALDDQSFLAQSYLNHNEREKMLFEVLDKTKQGLCTCVFDASDRIQHMFWRYLDPKHPAPKQTDNDYTQTIPQMYKKMDQLIGKVQSKLKAKDLLIVLSDHGFSSFRRCINLNSWLAEQGYLVFKDGKNTGADYLKDVDWSKTKAFALGLSGLYINKLGREQSGIVDQDQYLKLKKEIAQKLENLLDPIDNQKSIIKVYDSSQAYRGLYTDEAPDLIVGYAPGYRVSWDSITGIVEKDVFSDNLKAWSGDHHIDPSLVPGVLFTSQPIKNNAPHIVDIAPSVLNLFGVKVPAYMEGKMLF